MTLDLLSIDAKVLRVVYKALIPCYPFGHSCHCCHSCCSPEASFASLKFLDYQTSSCIMASVLDLFSSLMFHRCLHKEDPPPYKFSCKFILHRRTTVVAHPSPWSSSLLVFLHSFSLDSITVHKSSAT